MSRQPAFSWLQASAARARTDDDDIVLERPARRSSGNQRRRNDPASRLRRGPRQNPGHDIRPRSAGYFLGRRPRVGRRAAARLRQAALAEARRREVETGLPSRPARQPSQPTRGLRRRLRPRSLPAVVRPVRTTSARIRRRKRHAARKPPRARASSVPARRGASPRPAAPRRAAELRDGSAPLCPLLLGGCGREFDLRRDGGSARLARAEKDSAGFIERADQSERSRSSQPN